MCSDICVVFYQLVPSLLQATRSLSSESNCDSKSPFVLQTLKRLEKSQSILVIRNSTASTAATNTSMATSPPNGNSLATSSILSVTRTTKAAKGVAGALHKLKAAAATTATSGGASSAGATSSTATTILRLGKSATTVAINGASKLEATTSTTTAVPVPATATTSNKLSNAVTSEQQQQQQSTTTQTNVPLGNGKSRGFGITEFQMRRINCWRGFRQVLQLQLHLHRDRKTKPDAVSWLKISRAFVPHLCCLFWGALSLSLDDWLLFLFSYGIFADLPGIRRTWPASQLFN